MNVQLNPQSERILKDQLSTGRFRSPEEVIEHALETLAEDAQRRGAMDLAAFEAALDALAEGSENLPVLPAEATSRTEIYRDRN